MTNKTWRTYLLVALALLGIDWFLGVARFQWVVFGHVFTAVNFPLSLVYLWLEKQPSTWWFNYFGRPVNDEVGQFIAFLLMIGLQAAVYTTLLLLFKRWQTQTQRL